VLAATQPKARRVAYLGDMKELGETEAELHAAVADHPAMSKIDTVHCVGPLMKHLHAALPEEKRGRWTETSDEMAAKVPAELGIGDVVLAKGSLSMRLARVVDAIRKMGESPA
jgi:UDP-N-acetylmuramoyl-tripeptide--D-alanyl-D-alanine ligase